jgi:hypothetical protein
MINRAKLGITGSWQRGQRRPKCLQSYVGPLRSKNTQLCCKVGSRWYGGSDARGILWTALRITWTGSAVNRISVRHNAREDFASTIAVCVVVSDTCIQSPYRRLTCACYVACCVDCAVTRKSDMYVVLRAKHNVNAMHIHRTLSLER